MLELKELLDSILCDTTFAGPHAENIPPTQLRDLLTRRGWPDEEVSNARRARPIVSEESISRLADCFRSVLSDFVDPDEDSIGVSFPAGYGFRGYCRHQEDGFACHAWVAPVEALAKAILKGSAVLGTDTVTRRISGWLEGEPVEYKTVALLNSLPISESFTVKEGVRVEALPLSTDELPTNLPKHSGMPASEYLGRATLVIDSVARPAFFLPQADWQAPSAGTAIKPKADIVTLCQALSLGTNSYVGFGFLWHDYQDLEAFALSNPSSQSWAPFGARVKKRNFPFSTSNSHSTGVTTMIPSGERRVLDLEPASFSRILSNPQGKHFQKVRLALTRWIMSKDFEKNQVDKFIDLRIALESLYLQDFLNEQSQEMRFRLALFGAWHLGVDFEERKKIRRKLRDAYDTASGAVHGGDLKKKLATQELLSDAQDLCRRGILKMLAEGYPSQERWGDLILGVEYDEQ